MQTITVLADDLSGAAETAAVFMLRTTRILVALHATHTPAEVGGAGAMVTIYDTDSRHLVSPAAAERVRDVLRLAASGANPAATGAGGERVFKKIDSLLRGQLVAELVAVREFHPAIVLAPALPAVGRVVRDGVVHVAGRRLDESGVWHAETGLPPADIAAAVAPLRTVLLSLAVVRSARLTVALAEAFATGSIAVCDAETDHDLDLLIQGLAHRPDALLVGSAGLANALARSLPLPHRMTGDESALSEKPVPVPVSVSGSGSVSVSGSVSRPTPAAAGSVPGSGVLVVVGSAADQIPEQLADLRAVGARIILLDPAEVIQDADRVAQRIGVADGETVVVTWDPAAPIDQGASRALVLGLAAAVGPAAAAAGGVVLTGGETARAVLDWLQVVRLRPLREVHHGAVVSVDPDGRVIGTRPGSFGDHASLSAMVGAVRSLLAPGAGGRSDATASPAASRDESHPPTSAGSRPTSTEQPPTPVSSEAFPLNRSAGLTDEPVRSITNEEPE